MNNMTATMIMAITMTGMPAMGAAVNTTNGPIKMGGMAKAEPTHKNNN